ncbi:PAS domain-containing sensor histidine kinase [Ideonella sp.]|uniref:sensor histidine kinase n=1 Tax=Ideonella sp. TaxID=1929293 RepID=UPI0035B35276
MASDRLRVIGAAVLWLAAGAVARAAGPSARAWVGAAVLALAGLGLAWPLSRRPAPLAATPEAPPSADSHRLAVLQAQLEHLPVAAWVQVDERLLPLSSRARRLEAPGGVRDHAALRALLRGAMHSGPVVLDTERGSERWQLRRQPLALDGQAQNLLVLVPLEHELETESLLAWQQLVQVLTHEIMNSLTPIKSLSQTAQVLLSEPGAEGELRLALDAIAQRAESLSTFVRTYRRVSQWPAPEMAPVDLRELFARLQQAVGPGWAARGGEATFELASPSLRLQADEGQLEQALLALLNNAEQATADVAAPRLWVQARQGRGGRLQISVRDNGPGVPAGLERQIFLPFFSAREGGQGIGLTVVRQLVNGMGGRVRHVRPLEGGAAFVLSF